MKDLEQAAVEAAELAELDDKWRRRAPKEIWIDVDYFQEDGSVYECHNERVRVITNPNAESVAYPEGYFSFKFAGFPGEDAKPKPVDSAGIEHLRNEILAELSRVICTPEEGYNKAPHLLIGDLRKAVGMALSERERIRAKLREVRGKIDGLWEEISIGDHSIFWNDACRQSIAIIDELLGDK